MRSLDPPLFPFRMPSLWGQKQHRGQPEALAGEIRVARSPLQEPSFHGFQSMFFPMMESARDLFSHMGPMVDGDGDMEAPTSEGKGMTLLMLFSLLYNSVLKANVLRVWRFFFLLFFSRVLSFRLEIHELCLTFICFGCRRQCQRRRGYHQTFWHRPDDLQGDPAKLCRLHQAP